LDLKVPVLGAVGLGAVDDPGEADALGLADPLGLGVALSALAKMVPLPSPLAATAPRPAAPAMAAPMRASFMRFIEVLLLRVEWLGLEASRPTSSQPGRRVGFA
jgi:hypothetical protein